MDVNLGAPRTNAASRDTSTSRNPVPRKVRLWREGIGGRNWRALGGPCEAALSWSSCKSRSSSVRGSSAMRAPREADSGLMALDRCSACNNSHNTYAMNVI